MESTRPLLHCRCQLMRRGRGSSATSNPALNDLLFFGSAGGAGCRACGAGLLHRWRWVKRNRLLVLLRLERPAAGLLHDVREFVRGEVQIRRTAASPIVDIGAV